MQYECPIVAKVIAGGQGQTCDAVHWHNAILKSPATCSPRFAADATGNDASNKAASRAPLPAYCPTTNEQSKTIKENAAQCLILCKNQVIMLSVQ